MPGRLRLADPSDVAASLRHLDAVEDPSLAGADPADVRLLVRHSLAKLAGNAPGRSVEVRVPPYAAVQCVPGPRHTRGTPPGVVETDPATWLQLARGRLSWEDAVASGRISASGERTDLGQFLPLL